MRLLPLLPIVGLGLMACNSNGTPGSAGSGTGGTTSTGSGGNVAGTTGGSPIGLWLGGSAAVNATELSLGGDQKLSDSCPPPDPNADPAGAAAFDGKGNLWVQYPSDTNPIYMWTASQLGESCASGEPAVTLTLGSFGPAEEDQQFSGIAFDSQGNLWCVNPGISEGVREDGESDLVGFRASDLAASGSIEPAWGFQGGGAATDDLLGPISLAFDRAGNLWVGNAYSAIAYSPATLAAAVVVDGGISQSFVPADLRITDPHNDLAEDSAAQFALRYLAFDADGDLWVTIENTEDGGVNQIVEFSSAQLAALSSSDEPTPAAVLTADVANSVVWGPLAFDSSGTLWAGVQGGHVDLYGFSKTHLVTGSHPDLTATVPGGSAASLAFDPIPSGLPIQP